MAEKNRRASVQFNIRLEPDEAELIRRVIPKRHLRPLLPFASRLRPPARSPDADSSRGGCHSRIDPRNGEGALAGAPHAQAHTITGVIRSALLEHDHARMDRPDCHALRRRVAVSVYLASLADAAPLPRCSGVSTARFARRYG